MRAFGCCSTGGPTTGRRPQIFDLTERCSDETCYIRFFWKTVCFVSCRPPQRCRAPGLRSRGNDLQRRPSWTRWSITIMSEFNDIADIFDFSSYYGGCEPESNSLDVSYPATHPPILHPLSPSSQSSLSTLSDSTGLTSPSLTDEEDAHYNNVIFHGVDSPVLLTTTIHHMVESSMTLNPSPPPFASHSPIHAYTPVPATPSTASSPSPTSHGPPSPRVPKRRRSATESTGSEPGSSTSRAHPVKKPRLPVPGESSFQLDVQVPSFTPVTPLEAPMGRTRQRVDRSACKCPDKSQKPARHWKTACPYNPDRLRFDCPHCTESFSRRDNRDRHVEDFH